MPLDSIPRLKRRYSSSNGSPGRATTYISGRHRLAAQRRRPLHVLDVRSGRHAALNQLAGRHLRLDLGEPAAQHAAADPGPAATPGQGRHGDAAGLEVLVEAVALGPE